MESMLYRGHRFLGSIKHFWTAVRVWKMNLILEDLAHQKQMKMWPKWGLLWGLMDVWQSEWSVLSWICFTKLSMTFWPRNWACRKFVQSWFQKNLTNEQKENRRNVCLDLLERIKNDEKFFKFVITGDESWIFEYDSETKRRSSKWHTSNSPRPKKARLSKSKI